MTEDAAVEAYIAAYKQKHDFFRVAAELCHDCCHKILQSSGIRHFSAFRAKDEERLRDKLYQRLKRGHRYTNDADIEKDIVDLAGVRIALYFPAQGPDAVRALIEQGQIFRMLEPPRIFPKEERRRGAEIYQYHFAGYQATHLNVALSSDALPQESKRYGGARIEIQIASVFMHAWAEVEHDLVYKPLRGELSIEEYSWLDQVNGFALAGNVALEQLQRSMNARVEQENRPFSNQYDLASFIHQQTSRTSKGQPLMGRVDQLLPFLALLKLDRPNRLQEFLEVVDASESVTLVERIAERIISFEHTEAEQRRKAWEGVRSSAGPNPYMEGDTEIARTAMAYALQQRFRKGWAVLDTAVRHVLDRAADATAPTRAFTWLRPDLLQKTLGFDARTSQAIIEAHQAQTRLNTASWHGAYEELEMHERSVRDAIQWLYGEYPSFLAEGRDEA